MNKHIENNRRFAIGFSIVGSLVIIAFFFITNYLTSWSFPWFIYPSFAVIWWPLSVFFVGRHSMKVFSLVGSIAIIAVLFITNYLTSWSFPWFIYPSFAVIWWPLAVFFGQKYGKTLAIVGSLAIIAFSVVINYITSPSYLWFPYPSFAVMWWPLSVFLMKPRTAKAYSVISSLVILAFFSADSLINSPSTPWILFTIFPVLLWPICVFLDRRVLELPTALGLSVVGIAYYIMLNILIFPGFPWAIFPAYVLLWWPLSVAFARRGHTMLFSICGTLLSVAFFISFNVLATPQTIWAVYPIFALAWWPLTTYYFVYKPRRLLER